MVAPSSSKATRSTPFRAAGCAPSGRPLCSSSTTRSDFEGAQLDGRQVTWDEIDQTVSARIAQVLAGGGRVRSAQRYTVTSPTEQHWIDRFLAQFSDGRHVVYDPLSSSAILDAHLATHGQRLLPRYFFDRADVIVSFGADFLGTWISPVEFTAAYQRGRRLDDGSPHMSYHAQVEGRMSLTGSNADRRLLVDPADTGLVLSHLARRVADHREGAPPAFRELAAPPVDEAILDELAQRLWQARGRALVVSDSQSREEQVMVNYLNQQLGAYGATLDLERPSFQRQGDDRALAGLVSEIEEGGVDLLLIRGVNPVYDLPRPELAAALEALPFVVSFAGGLDETATRADAICPEPHFLEAWSDSEAVAGVVSITQPAIRPLRETRGLAESLATWLGEPRPALDLIRDHWGQTVFPRAAAGSFETFWDHTLRDGGAPRSPSNPSTVSPFDPSVVRPLAAGVKDELLTLELYPKIGMLDGRHAHNPWLQELADPVTKVVWDNYASLSPGTAGRLGVGENDVVRLELAGEPALELPVFVQPGQHDRVVAVALGYGRAGTDRFSSKIAPKWLQGKPTIEPGATVGSNAAPLTTLGKDGRRYHRPGLRVTPTGMSLTTSPRPRPTTISRCRRRWLRPTARTGRSSRRRFCPTTSRIGLRVTRTCITSTPISGASTSSKSTIGRWRSISPPVRAARRVSSPVRRRTTSQWWAGTRSSVAGRCSGSASIATTVATAMPRIPFTSR